MVATICAVVIDSYPKLCFSLSLFVHVYKTRYAPLPTTRPDRQMGGLGDIETERKTHSWTNRWKRDIQKVMQIGSYVKTD